MPSSLGKAKSAASKNPALSHQDSSNTGDSGSQSQIFAQEGIGISCCTETNWFVVFLIISALGNYVYRIEPKRVKRF